LRPAAHAPRLRAPRAARSCAPAPRATRALDDLACGARGSARRVDEELAVGLPRLAVLEGRGGVDQWEAAVDRDLQGPGGDLRQQGAQSGAIRPPAYPASTGLPYRRILARAGAAAARHRQQ